MGAASANHSTDWWLGWDSNPRPRHYELIQQLAAGRPLHLALLRTTRHHSVTQKSGSPIQPSPSHLFRNDPLLPVGIPKTRRSNCKKRASAEPRSQAALRAAASHGTGKPTLRRRDRGREVGTRTGSSAVDRSARSARALASFASYADPLMSHTETVNSGPERHSDLGKAETS